MKKSFYLLIALSLILTGCGSKSSSPTLLPPNPGTDTGEKHNHSFGEWVVVTPPKCEETGLKERTCECGYSENEIVPALGHNPAGINISATCEDPGYKNRVECINCGFVYEEGTYLPPLGHDRNQYTGTCNTCGDEIFEEGTFICGTNTSISSYTFTENKDYIIKIDIPFACSIGFGLYSEKGNNAYNAYDEEGHQFLLNATKSLIFQVSRAISLYVHVTVTDYTLAKYFRFTCQHNLDDLGICTDCGYDKSYNGDLMFDSSRTIMFVTDLAVYIKFTDPTTSIKITISGTNSVNPTVVLSKVTTLDGNSVSFDSSNNTFSPNGKTVVVKLMCTSGRGNMSISASRV